MDSKNVNLRQYSTLQSHVFETLICLEYLLRFTSIDKPTKQKDIVDFANEKYNFYTRRDRIGNILRVIYENRDILNDKYNIDIQEALYQNGEKYYVNRRLMNDDEIKDVMASITANQALSDSNKQHLNDLIFNMSNKDNDLETRKIVDKEVAKSQFNLSSLSKKNLENYFKIKSYAEQHKYLIIKLEKRYYRPSVKEEFISPFILEGRIYDIFNIKEKICLHFISSKNNEIVSIKLDNIVKIDARLYDSGRSIEDLNKCFNKKGYKDIDDYLKKNPLANNNTRNENLVFKIYTSCPDYQYIRNQFINTFGSDFNIIKEEFSKDNKIKMQTISIDAESYLIHIFLKDYSVLLHCDIISPDSIKELIEMDIKRIQKHLQPKE